MVYGKWNLTELKQYKNSGVEAFWPKAVRKVLPLLDRGPFGVSLYVKGKNIK